MRAQILAAVLILAAAPAAAKPRDAAQRAVLVELAGVLGESHALRQACEGPEDQFWRARMLRLLEIEAPPPDLTSDLKGAFNDGYSEGREAHPVCSARTRQVEAEAAARGRTLAGRLTRAVRTGPAGAR